VNRAAWSAKREKERSMVSVAAFACAEKREAR
jgi:hypothetical protein